ncbi:MAG: hypothetical protein JNK89_03320, partial [Saprospiraceae bacterium]|nr:hypothetical protein [Saprospiraceae bacterium]
VYWILATVWTLLALLPAALFFEPAIEHFPSEKYAFWGMALLIVLWLKGLAFLIISSVLSRLEGLQSGKSTGYCVRSGFRMFWKNKVPQSLLFAAFAGLLLLVSAVYWWLDAAAGMQTPVLVLVFFALQQGVMFSRILFRQMWYAAMAKTMLT